MAKRTIADVEVSGKRVFLRADFNVPFTATGAIADDRRIRMTLPSIESVLRRGGSLVLASHLGRPKGKGFEPEFSLAPVARRLSELLGVLVRKPVTVPSHSCVDDASRAAVTALRPGEAVLLENLRFEPGEKQGDSAFAASLAVCGQIYCNDAFGCSHRNDASMFALPAAMAGKPRVAGLLLAKEVQYLSGVIHSPSHPFVAIVGGAKVSDKLAALRNLIGRVDTILVGGAMAYTLLSARGIAVGRSMIQSDMASSAAEILALASRQGTALELPIDHVCGEKLEAHTPLRYCTGAIDEGWMGLDIGAATVQRYSEIVAGAKLIVWNGPMGAFETKPFDQGTMALARAIVSATKRGATSVVGGGDSAAAVEEAGLAGEFSHVSTGGGASLELLEGRAFDTFTVLDDG
ncbi:MAG: phosphoglycerate kinase [Phycisphaerales bacterium]|nr:phosphoglycerate kinase [Phycisphaerales bacterium]